MNLHCDISTAQRRGGLTISRAGRRRQQAFERFCAVRSREKTIAEDRRIAKRLLEAFGDVPLSEMTASRISACKAVRLASKHPGTGEPLTASAVNRPLGFLRAVLGMAHSEWEVLPAVPKVKLETEPEGRIRWLEADEEPRLLEACRRSNLSHLEGFTVCAMETGMRPGRAYGPDMGSRGLLARGGQARGDEVGQAPGGADADQGLRGALRSRGPAPPG
jgi:integrase